MNYIKVTFKITPDTSEYREILIAQLAGYEYESFEESTERVIAYCKEEDYRQETLKEIDFSPLFDFESNTELIPDQNWNEVWEKNYFAPLVIANKCLIRAPFHTNYPNAEIELIIEPKMAFGTGNHETTTLMVEFLLKNAPKGKQVLDMGCGTGILAMVASKLNAEAVTAIDIDKWSFESTRENCELNNCKNVKTLMGDASLLGDEKFDLILANIHKNVLLEDMNAYHTVLNPNGKLIISGFYKNDLDDLNQKALSIGLKPASCKTKNKWTAQIYLKS